MDGDRWALVVALSASLGSLLFGLHIGYIGPILESPSFKRDVAHLSDWEDPKSSIPGSSAGFIAGAFPIGCIAASFPVVSAFLIDATGRRASIMLGNAVFVCAALLQASARSLRQMVLGRLVGGCAVGLLSTVVPLYQSEVAPPRMRGVFTSLNQLMITLGILVATALDVPLVTRDGGWRLSILLQLIPAVALLGAMCRMPRSPRWLVQQGRDVEALAVLTAMRGRDEARQELKDITTSVDEADSQGAVQWTELLTGRPLRLLLLGMALQLYQQWVGMNAFMYFGPRVFSSLGLRANVFQTLVSVVNFAATFPALYLVDKKGRKVLLVSGAIGMATACFVMATLGTPPATGATPSGGHFWLALLVVGMVFAFVVNFAYGWGPITWVYCSEIFPLKFRSRCVGLTTMANWCGHYLVVQLTPVLLERFGFKTFLIFGALCIQALLLALWIPETKGVPLEHIDELFDAKFGPSVRTLSLSVPPSSIGISIPVVDSD